MDIQPGLWIPRFCLWVRVFSFRLSKIFSSVGLNIWLGSVNRGDVEVSLSVGVGCCQVNIFSWFGCVFSWLVFGVVEVCGVRSVCCLCGGESKLLIWVVFSGSILGIDLDVCGIDFGACGGKEGISDCEVVSEVVVAGIVLEGAVAGGILAGMGDVGVANGFIGGKIFCGVG